MAGHAHQPRGDSQAITPPRGWSRPQLLPFAGRFKNYEASLSPEYLAGINRYETEESYAAIAPDGLIVFLGEGPADANGPDWNLYQTRLTGNTAAPPTPFAPAATSAGESDPWFARDGSYVIFTRWDRARAVK